jgi:hypothetical protein
MEQYTTPLNKVSWIITTKKEYTTTENLKKIESNSVWPETIKHIFEERFSIGDNNIQKLKNIEKQMDALKNKYNDPNLNTLLDKAKQHFENRLQFLEQSKNHLLNSRNDVIFSALTWIDLDNITSAATIDDDFSNTIKDHLRNDNIKEIRKFHKDQTNQTNTEDQTNQTNTDKYKINPALYKDTKWYLKGWNVRWNDLWHGRKTQIITAYNNVVFWVPASDKKLESEINTIILKKENEGKNMIAKSKNEWYESSNAKSITQPKESIKQPEETQPEESIKQPEESIKQPEETQPEEKNMIEKSINEWYGFGNGKSILDQETKKAFMNKVAQLPPETIIKIWASVDSRPVRKETEASIKKDQEQLEKWVDDTIKTALDFQATTFAMENNLDVWNRDLLYNRALSFIKAAKEANPKIKIDLNNIQFSVNKYDAKKSDITQRSVSAQWIIW